MTLSITALIAHIQRLTDPLHEGSRRAIRSSNRDIGVAADLALHEDIATYLAEHSKCPVISEEAERPKTVPNTSYWLLDPLDGSVNFNRGIPLHVVSVALWRGLEPQLGIIWDFSRRELLCGICPGTNLGYPPGATLNGGEIRCSQVDTPAQGLLATGVPAGQDLSGDNLAQWFALTRSWLKLRWLGSAALSLGWLAAGRIDAYAETDIRLWDVGAGLALVRAAGGNFEISPSGDDYRYRVRATNGKLPLSTMDGSTMDGSTIDGSNMNGSAMDTET